MESPTDVDHPQHQDEPTFGYTYSPGLAESLEQAGVTLLVSTYQAGKLCVFRSSDGRLTMLPRTFDKVMGLAADPTRIAIATRYQIWFLRNEPILAPKIKPLDTHDACFVPRSSHITGNIDAHEIGWAGDELWIVNTQFSCLCTLDPDYSFVPRWWPPFVSNLARQDRCHLNGLAIAAERPVYATAFSATDTPEGWREHKLDGGCVIDVASGEIVARGFSMPHSPRVRQDRLWLLDSGNGSLVTVNVESGQTEVVANLPGYTRGLSFFGRYAFVGLSRIRETAVFGGAPIAERPDDRKCGVWVIDTESGHTVGFIEFQQTVDEIFDVQVLPNVRYPAVIGMEKDTIQRACVIGPPRPLQERPTTGRSIARLDRESAPSE